MDIKTISYMTRKPRRMTITLSDKTFRQLQDRSDSEGRSMSNLSAFLLEQALQETSHKTANRLSQ